MQTVGRLVLAGRFGAQLRELRVRLRPFSTAVTKIIEVLWDQIPSVAERRSNMVALQDRSSTLVNAASSAIFGA